MALRQVKSEPHTQHGDAWNQASLGGLPQREYNAAGDARQPRSLAVHVEETSAQQSKENMRAADKGGAPESSGTLRGKALESARDIATVAGSKQLLRMGDDIFHVRARVLHQLATLRASRTFLESSLERLYGGRQGINTSDLQSNHLARKQNDAAGSTEGPTSNTLVKGQGSASATSTPAAQFCLDLERVRKQEDDFTAALESLSNMEYSLHEKQTALAGGFRSTDDATKVVHETTAQIRASLEASESTRLTSNIPSIVERYFDRRGDVGLLLERRGELLEAWAEAVAERELLADRGDPVDSTEEEFKASYQERLADVDRELRAAQDDADQLERLCAEQGLNVEQFRTTKHSETSSESPPLSAIIEAGHVAKDSSTTKHQSAGRIGSWLQEMPSSDKDSSESNRASLTASDTPRQLATNMLGNVSTPPYKPMNDVRLSSKIPSKAATPRPPSSNFSNARPVNESLAVRQKNQYTMTAYNQSTTMRGTDWQWDTIARLWYRYDPRLRCEIFENGSRREPRTVALGSNPSPSAAHHYAGPTAQQNNYSIGTTGRVNVSAMPTIEARSVAADKHREMRNDRETPNRESARASLSLTSRPPLHNEQSERTDSNGDRFLDVRNSSNEVQTRLKLGPAARITDPALFRQGISASQMVMPTEGDSERLFADYKRREQPRRFFTCGKVFRVLWSEPGGDSQTAVTFMQGISIGRFGERVYSKVRFFVVIREGEKFCSALPIATNGGQGAAKRGVKKSDFSIIYSGSTAPMPSEEEAPTRGEQGMRPDAIRVNPDDRADPLSERSRINYGKVYTIEHNIKVKPYGQVHPASLDALRHQFLNVWLGEHAIGAAARSWSDPDVVGKPMPVARDQVRPTQRTSRPTGNDGSSSSQRPGQKSTPGSTSDTREAQAKAAVQRLMQAGRTREQAIDIIRSAALRQQEQARKQESLSEDSELERDGTSSDDTDDEATKKRASEVKDRKSTAADQGGRNIRQI